MRRLLLLRHAKADPNHRGGSGDHGRALTARGRDDAARIGGHIGALPFAIDRAIVSDAARTRETFACACAQFSPTPPVRYEPRLYDGDWRAFLTLVRAVPGDVANLLLVGHNPDIATLGRQLAGAGPAADLHALHQGFPTGALAIIDCEGKDWAGLAPARARLQAFVTPAQLGGGPD